MAATRWRAACCGACRRLRKPPAARTHAFAGRDTRFGSRKCPRGVSCECGGGVGPLRDPATPDRARYAPSDSANLARCSLARASCPFHPREFLVGNGYGGRVCDEAVRLVQIASGPARTDRSSGIAAPLRLRDAFGTAQSSAFWQQGPGAAATLCAEAGAIAAFAGYSLRLCPSSRESLSRFGRGPSPEVPKRPVDNHFRRNPLRDLCP